ncbi:hypothetical protein ACH47B_26290 [Rhodococcus sp. NPDC019627]|uniref:hypothetical protein n=1 Tax=unclassified Rhodococcus (in: high G+C Gram-positive bacteria) TaxID=192944 RepID=UPI00340FA969
MAASPRAAIAVLAAATVVLAGCSAGSEDRSAPASTTPARAQQWTPSGAPPATVTRPHATIPQTAPEQVAGVDRSDPAAVADVVVATWFTWNTAVDAGPNDAAARTGALLTEQLRADLTGTAPISTPGGQWLEWATARAQVWPTVTPVANQGAKDTATTVHRMYQVEQTAVAPDNSVVGVATTQVAVLVVAHGDYWSVDAVQPL